MRVLGGIFRGYVCYMMFVFVFCDEFTSWTMHAMASGTCDEF